MIKRTIKETIREFDENGKVKYESVTETVEEDESDPVYPNTPYGPYSPVNPYGPIIYGTGTNPGQPIINLYSDTSKTPSGSHQDAPGSEVE